MEITKSLVQTESCDENLKAFEAEFLVDRLEELDISGRVFQNPTALIASPSWELN